MDLQAPRRSLLAWLLHIAPLVGMIAFGLTIVGSAVTAIIVTNTWFVTLNNRLDGIQAEEKAEHDDIKQLQADMKNVDKRINELAAQTSHNDTTMEAELRKLHAESEAADAVMRGRIDVLDERSKFAADRALQPPLPVPYRASAGR